MGKKAPPGTQSVMRAVGLLKTLTSSGREMDLAELTRAAGLARTTTHRLLSALESEGLIARNPATNAYRLGPAAIALGSQALRSNDLRGIVHPYLVELAEGTGETSTLEVLSDGRMLILDEVLGRHLVGTNPSMGTSWAVHATSTGKAVLAALPESEREELLRPPLERFTEHTITRLDDLREALERVRRQGWAEATDELGDGYVAVGAAIHDALGKPVGGISVNAPTSRMNRKRIRETGELIRATAARVSAVLGHE